MLNTCQWIHFVAGLFSLNVCCKCRSPFMWSSWDCRNKSPPTKCLQTAAIHSLTIPDARSTKSRCQQGHISSQDSREWSFLSSSASGDCWQPLVSLACGSISPVSASIVTWASPCLSLCVFSSASYNGYSSVHLQITIIQDYLTSRSLP